jgi:DNA invertase Pin-like site-specific DNA recombinase
MRETLPKFDTECESAARELMMRLSLAETRPAQVKTILETYAKAGSISATAEALSCSKVTLDRAVAKIPELAAGIKAIRERRYNAPPKKPSKR